MPQRLIAYSQLSFKRSVGIRTKKAGWGIRCLKLSGLSSYFVIG